VKRMTSFASICTALVLLVGISGCDSVYYGAWEKLGYEKRDLLVSEVEDAMESQEEAKEQFKSALDQFASVVNIEDSDLKSMYDDLSAEYEEATERAEAVSSHIDDVEDVSQDLFAEWRSEIEQYTSADLKRSSQTQLRTTESKYKTLLSSMRKAEGRMEPVLNVFRDQVLFLKHNLNAQAIAGLRSELNTVENDVAILIADMEDAILLTWKMRSRAPRPLSKTSKLVPEFDNILYAVNGPMALITINRADKHNAISLATLDELQTAVRLVDRDESVRVLTITGAGGRAFAAGSDLSEVIDRDLKKALEPIVQGLADQLERMPKPTIAAIDGICMGGGLEVALGCDLRIATPESRFATPEGKLGIIPGGGATARLPRIVGRGWGMEMLLMGEPIDAQRALQIGLVTRLVAQDELLAEAERMATQLAQFAPFVPRTMKAMVNFGMEGSLASALMFEKYAQGALVQTEDKAEGISAFLEKRPPVFKGK